MLRFATSTAEACESALSEAARERQGHIGQIFNSIEGHHGSAKTRASVSPDFQPGHKKLVKLPKQPMRSFGHKKRRKPKRLKPYWFELKPPADVSTAEACESHGRLLEKRTTPISYRADLPCKYAATPPSAIWLSCLHELSWLQSARPSWKGWLGHVLCLWSGTEVKLEGLAGSQPRWLRLSMQA
eukprot:g21319.t1